MKARVLRSRHSGLTEGMIGTVEGPKDDGFAVRFEDVKIYGRSVSAAAVIFCARDEIELIEETLPTFESFNETHPE